MRPCAFSSTEKLLLLTFSYFRRARSVTILFFSVLGLFRVSELKFDGASICIPKSGSLGKNTWHVMIDVGDVTIVVIRKLGLIVFL